MDFVVFEAPMKILSLKNVLFLNQAQPARAWFLKITSVRMYACVCPAPQAMKNCSCEIKSE